MAKILHVTDLHFKEEWYSWVESNAHQYQFVCLSGDLLDMGNETSLPQQVIWLAGWLESFQRHKVPIAICGGNHELNLLDDAKDLPPELLSRLLATPSWMDAFKTPLVIVDQENRVVPIGKSQIVVTTLPHPLETSESRQSIKALWSEGARLRALHKVPWVVLSHIPPVNSSIGDFACDEDLLSQIEFRQPDHVLCGHVHIAPYAHGGEWKEQIGRTLCYNPGYAKGTTKVPNYIEIDIVSGKSAWFSNRS